MQTKPFPTHDDVTRILMAARREAEKNKWAVTIAVVDAGA